MTTVTGWESSGPDWVFACPVCGEGSTDWRRLPSKVHWECPNCGAICVSDGEHMEAERTGRGEVMMELDDGGWDPFASGNPNVEVDYDPMTNVEPDEDQRWIMDLNAREVAPGKRTWFAPGTQWCIDTFPSYWEDALARAKGDVTAIAEVAGDPATDDGPVMAPELDRELKVPTLEELVTLRTRLDRKFEASDLTPGLKIAARGFAEAYEGDFEFMVSMKATMATKGTLSDGQAKGVLNAMTAGYWKVRKAQEQAKIAANTNPVTTPGAYVLDSVVYKVRKSQTTGRLYALKWTDGDWDFEAAKGVMAVLTPDHAMTLEDAESFGKNFGVCVQCGRTLTDPKSIARGIGPVCASKGWGA